MLCFVISIEKTEHVMLQLLINFHHQRQRNINNAYLNEFSNLSK